jgi:hypothetical protein
MSSNYRRICLSHDPPLMIDEDVERCVPPAQPLGHPDCKIALGRWSGGLVELWLPIPYSRRAQPGEVGDPLVHLPGDWYDVSWLHRAKPLARLIIEDWI